MKSQKTDKWEKEFEKIWLSPYVPQIRKCRLCGKDFDFKRRETGLYYCSNCRFKYTERHNIEFQYPRYKKDNYRRDQIRDFIIKLLSQVEQQTRKSTLQKIKNKVEEYKCNFNYDYKKNKAKHKSYIALSDLLNLLKEI